MVTSVIDGIRYGDMPFRARALSKTNPKLVKAEREFWQGKRWPEIRVYVEFADGSKRYAPTKLKGDRVL